MYGERTLLDDLFRFLRQCICALLLGCTYVVFGAPVVVYVSVIIHFIYSTFTGGL